MPKTVEAMDASAEFVLPGRLRVPEPLRERVSVLAEVVLKAWVLK